jgi:hypothetical protein
VRDANELREREPRAANPRPPTGKSPRLKMACCLQPMAKRSVDMKRLAVPHDGKRIAAGAAAAVVGLAVFFVLILLLIRAS